MRYPPEYESESKAKFIFVGESSPTPARVDAFVATAETHLRSNVTDRVDDHLQNLYHDTLVSFLLKKFERVVCTLRIFA